MLRFLCALILWLSAAGWAAAEALQGEIARTAAPPWVELIDLPEVDPEMVRYARDGEYWLLYDEQMAWDEEVRLAYQRRAVKVLNRAGLEAVGTIRRDFDPAVEELSLVSVAIIRDGQRIELADRVKPEILRLEEDLPDGIIDGTRTALIQVPGLRVGDILDVGVLWRRKPLFPGQMFNGLFDYEFGAPVGLTRLVLHWPKDQPFRTSPIAGGVRLSDRTEADGARRIEMTRVAHEPLTVEDGLPPEVDPWNMIQFSSATSWAEVSAPYETHHDARHPVPADWAGEVEALARANLSETERAYAALRMVQDKIRYVGVEMGHGGYFATDPAEVVADGFGDCKGKSLLLVTVLRALGIEADVALADLDHGYRLDRMIPSDWAFDHMIVRAVADGQVIWMDGTGSHEGGGGVGAVQPDLGFAVPITGKRAGQLEPIGDDPDNTGLMQVTETFRFYGDALLLDVVTEASGSAADQMRWIWATDSPDAIEARYLGYYDTLYAGIEALAAPEISDSRSVNKLRIVESYRLPPERLADADFSASFPFQADGFDKALAVPEDADRARPFYLSRPYERVHRVRVESLPREVTVEEPVRITSDAFSYSYQATAGQNRTLSIDWHFKPTARSVAPDEIETYIADREKMVETTWVSWDLSRPDPVAGFWQKLVEKAQERAAQQPTP